MAASGRTVVAVFILPRAYPDKVASGVQFRIRYLDQWQELMTLTYSF